MSRLLLVRHGLAGARRASGSDRDRRLTPAGRLAVQSVGTRLRPLGPAPDLALCSPALRTCETLDLLLAAWRATPEVVLDDLLYLADAPTLLGQLRAVPPETETALLVGHNPGLEELARQLALSSAQSFPAGFPASGAAVFEVTGHWSELSQASARLAAFITP